MALSSIEKAAASLDTMRASRAKEDKVDFDAYMKGRSNDTALIKAAGDFRDDLHQEFFGEDELKGSYLPWRKVDDKFRLRQGELTVWTGFNGHGKSMALGYVTLSQIDQGAKACILSFEMKPKRTLSRMARQAIGTGRPSEGYVDKFMDYIAGKLWLYDQNDAVTPARVLAVITYCAEQLGITLFVIDSLMKVVADEDDMNGMKRFVGDLHRTAQNLNIQIHLVHHSRKKEDETKRPGKMDAKGSGAVVDQTDNFVVVFKLPEKKGPDGKPLDPTMPTHMMYLDKQRNGEFEGAWSLWFDEYSFQFKETHMDRVKVLVR